MATGKQPVMCSARLAYALDSLSKNTLIDILVDYAITDVGEDKATDETLAHAIQARADIILRMRGMTRVVLENRMYSFDVHSEKYREQHGS